MKHAGMVVILKLFIVSLVLAQTPKESIKNEESIEVGAIELRLGMLQDEVLTKLRKEYTVEKEKQDTWFVYRTPPPPYDSIPNLGFKNGKLDNVYKSWEPSFPPNILGVPFARALYNAVAALTENKAKLCFVSNGETINQLAEMRTTFIVCGKKRIQVLSVRTSDGNEGVNITEILKND